MIFKTTNLGIATNWTTQKVVNKLVRTQFITIWTPTFIKEGGENFRKNFQASLWTKPHKYKVVNLKCITWFQQEVQQQAQTKQ
jgi:hypothetical protein